jgi:nicotinamidase-related amidase
MERPEFVLLVVDMLNDYFRQHTTLSTQQPQLVDAINRLTRTFRKRGLPVIWIRQEFAPDLNDAFLDMRRRNVRVTIAGTDGCHILPELERDQSDIVIVKKRYSAFFGTDLDTILGALRPKSIVIAGINTHACVRTTAIDAYQRDYDVVVVSNGVASVDAEHDRITRKYLDGKIARFVCSEELARCCSAQPDV